MSTILTEVESKVEEGRIERRESKAYQIFPEANMDKESDYTSYSEEFLYQRERLPSIVVEPTELERGGLCRCAQYHKSKSMDEEENNSANDTDISLNRKQQEDMAIEESVTARRSSLGPSQSQLPITRLTPPPSPTHPEAAPPCLKNITN